MDPLLEVARAARDRRDRGRLPGARRPLPRPPRRHARRRRLLQLLPGQEPRRLGRRRRAWSPTDPSSPTACACCARTASARATTTASSGTTAPPRRAPGRDPARQAAPPRRLERRPPPRGGRRCARALQGTGVEPPRRARCDGGDHVYHLFVVRTDERDALRAHLTAHGIATAVHYPVPDPPHRGLRAARPRAGQRCRSPSGWPSRSARCRCSRGSTTTRSAPSPRRWPT